MTLCKAVLSLGILMLSSLALAQGTYTQIDVPGALSTTLIGIDSAADVVGWYVDTGGSYHGFLLSGGAYTTLDVPGASETYAQGINDLGQIVGGSVSGTGQDGFLYDVQSHTFTTIAFPGASATYLQKINNAGIIVGSALNQRNSPTGFEYVGGTFKHVLPPGWKNSGLSGVNNSGAAVGSGATASGTLRNFAFSHGTFQLPRIPASAVVVVGINDEHAIIGSYTATSGLAGFVYQRGNFQPLAFPGFGATSAQGINDGGEVVGWFLDQSGNYHGFLWTPPAAAREK